MIKHLNVLPDGLLDQPATGLHRVLDGPTVIHLEGGPRRPLFVSVLQHGNEDSGWEAIRALLTPEYRASLPRPMILFIANVEAARYGQRRLDHQPDFNRCWPGSPPAASALNRALRALTDEMESADLFASVDIHNNSGDNPHYAAINRLKPQWLNLAQMFERRAIYFRQPKGTQSDAFSRFCPSVTLECGRVTTGQAAPRCVEFLRQLMTMDTIDDKFDHDPDFTLYETLARVVVAPGVEFSFDGEDADVQFIENLDRLNFEPVTAGTRLAAVSRSPAVHALTAKGDDVTEKYLARQGSWLVAGRNFTPAMLSTNATIVRQDCLCYIMQPMDWVRGMDSSQRRIPA